MTELSSPAGLSRSPVVLLTGGTGFLGSNLAAALLQDGYKVVLLKRSFSDTSRIASLLDQVTCYDIDRIDLDTPFKNHPVSMIVHCATNYGRYAVRPSELIEANLILPLKLLQLAEVHRVKGFMNTDTILPKGLSSYSLSKNQFVDWLQQFSESLVCMNVVLEHFYGPNDDPSKFVSRVIQDIQNEVPEIVLTPGAQKRDFVYISDVVEAFRKILAHAYTKSNGFERFEVGTGQSVSIREMVTLLKELHGNSKTDLKFGAIPYRKNEPMDIRVDIAQLTALGWSAKVALKDGLTKTIQHQKVKPRL